MALVDPLTPRRVVITGMDAISVLGPDLSTITQSLRSGRSGIERNDEREALGFRSALSGRVAAYDAKAHFDRRARKSMGETAMHAALTAKRAIERSACADLLDSPRAGILFGNDSSAEVIPSILDTVHEEKSTGTIGSAAVIKALNSTATINLGPMLKTKGISLTVSGACASGSHAVGLSAMLISLGLQDLVIAGGAQETNWPSMAAFDALRTFSTRMDDPAAASRPFDRDRDGLVPSGGGACLVLESLESAQQRGAPILAEILAYTFSSDGYHLTAGDGLGAERCMREAIERAEIQASDIDYINAHATSTAAGDAAEARAIDAVFGPHIPSLSSTKSMTGHECWMAGASELVYSILMMQNDFIAPNINWHNQDPDLPSLPLVTQANHTAQVQTVLSNSFGFGGTNACIVLRKWQG